jgi:hypothetical protein
MKTLMIAAPKLTVMMVTMQMTLVVVLRHLPHKKQLMSNLSPFTADQFTHCTQDQDHGGPASSRIPLRTTNAPVDSSGSSSQWIDDVPITSPYKYHISDIQSQHLHVSATPQIMIMLPMIIF